MYKFVPMKWQEKDIEKLIEFYPNTKNKDLEKILNRSKKSIEKKAYLLGLKKSRDHIHRNISERNKKVGRDLTNDLIINEALKYKSLAEFNFYDPSVLNTARRKGILGEITKHMIKKSYSIPQLILQQIIEKIIGCETSYNDRNVIPPYEIDVYCEKYKIGFEYNGLYWHMNDSINKKDLCNNIGINLININMNTREYENDIKSQIIDNIVEISKNVFIRKEDVLSINIDYLSIFDRIEDVEDIKRSCSEYDSYNLFVKNNKRIYNKLRRMNLLEEFTNHMDKKTIWDRDSAMGEISKYEFLSDFIKNSNGCYQYILENKYNDLLKNLKRKKRHITMEYCYDFIKNNDIKITSDIKKLDNSVYRFLLKKIGPQGIRDLIMRI